MMFWGGRWGDVANMIRQVETLINRSRFGAIWRMRYYAGGLALQKGLPLILLPLIVAVFGRENYGYYVLIFSGVQIYATTISLGIPLAVVPTWFHRDDPLRFVSLCYALVLGLAAVFGFTTILAAALWNAPVAGTMRAVEAAAWVILFALFYNVNIISMGVVRSQGRQHAFFYASVFGGVVLSLGVAMAYLLGQVGLRSLILVQVAAFGSATLALLGRSVVRDVRFPQRSYWREALPLVRYSIPLGLNTLLLVVSMGIDKWFATAFFPRQDFLTYVINYQAAFAMMFVPAVVSLYVGPIFSELVARKDWQAVRHEERKAMIINIAGSVSVAIGMFAYAWITGLRLTGGYWVFVVTFILQGQYVVQSTQLMAQMRSVWLLMTTLIGMVVFTALLLMAGLTRNLYLLYMAAPIYDGLLLALISWRKRPSIAD